MSRNYSSSNDGPNPIFIGLIILTVLAVLIFGGAFLFARQRVDPGNIGVLIDYAKSGQNGQPFYENVPTGSYRWVGFQQRLVEYPISQQTLVLSGENTVNCRDKNGIRVGNDVTILWRVDPQNAASLYFLRPGLDLKAIEESVVRRDSASAVGLSCSKYTYEQLYGVGKTDVNHDITGLLSPVLATSFIIVDRVVLGETHLDAPQQQALEAKALADQDAQRAAFAKVKAQNEAEGLVAQAQGKQRVAEIEAQQRANNTIAQAQADQKALALLIESLGGAQNYLQWLQVNKWNGVLPTTQLGSDTPVIVGPTR